MNEILWFLVFFIPAYIANMAPPFFRKLPFATPLDFGKKLNGKQIFGKNKTWRGLIVGTLLGGLTGYIMQVSGLPFVWYWGFALGFAALLGDAIKSFFKRQVGIRPGGRWMPFDQIDYLIVAYIVSLFLVTFTWQATVVGFIIIFVGTVLVQIAGGRTGIKADEL